MKHILIGIALLLVPAASGYAEIPLRDYNNAKRQPCFKSYILGVGLGYSWANAELHSRHQSKLYCQPDEVALTQSDYLAILDGEVKLAPGDWPQLFPIESMLLEGLQRRFPCR